MACIWVHLQDAEILYYCGKAVDGQECPERMEPSDAHNLGIPKGADESVMQALKTHV